MRLIHEPLSTGRQAVLGVVGVIGVAAVAELLMRTVVSKEGLPVPSKVLGSLGDLFADGTFWQAVGFVPDRIVDEEPGRRPYLLMVLRS